MKEALTYDDISIIPKHSNILHRDDVSTITEVTKNIYLEAQMIPRVKIACISGTSNSCAL